jgi:hypothetical protein
MRNVTYSLTPKSEQMSAEEEPLRSESTQLCELRQGLGQMRRLRSHHEALHPAQLRLLPRDASRTPGISSEREHHPLRCSRGI